MHSLIKIHAVISGFTERENQWHGSATLVEKIIDNLGVSKDIRVLLFPWHANWRMIASRFWFIGEQNKKRVAVNIYGYSWGAGWGAVNLARELGWQGIDVHNMTLCDPVYRHRYWLGNWRAFSNHPIGRILTLGRDVPIRIPPNVHRVRWTRQMVNYPRGHNLVADDVRTRIDNPTIVPVVHCRMDEHPEYHRLSLEAAQAL